MRLNFIFLVGICFLFFVSFVYADTINFSDEAAFERLLPLHKIKTPPGENDWLANHREDGQSYSEYIKSNPPLPSKDRRIIYITLLGKFSPAGKQIIKDTVKYIEAFFGLPVKFAPSISLSSIPSYAKRIHPLTHDHQILSSYVIEKILIPNMPSDAFCFLAFTSSDLWPGKGWNYVFGQASVVDRVGVWSIYRYGDPAKDQAAYKLCLKRAIKTGVHEICHILGFHHCIFYECVMNGSNYRIELDSRPLWLCPVCLRKLCWALGLDPVDRYRKLLKLCHDFGFIEEEAFFRKSIGVLMHE